LTKKCEYSDILTFFILFLVKYTTGPITTLKGNTPTLVNIRKKWWVSFPGQSGQVRSGPPSFLFVNKAVTHLATSVCKIKKNRRVRTIIFIIILS
jgi:hypothetical protein